MFYAIFPDPLLTCRGSAATVKLDLMRTRLHGPVHVKGLRSVSFAGWKKACSSFLTFGKPPRIPGAAPKP